MKHDYIDILHDRLSQHEMTEPSGLWQKIENSLDSHGTHKKKGLVASRSAIYKVVAGVAAAALVAIVMWTALNDENTTSLEGDKQDLALPPFPSSNAHLAPTERETLNLLLKINWQVLAHLSRSQMSNPKGL